MQKLEDQVDKIDIVFYARMMEKVQKQSGFRKYIYWAAAEAFRSIVSRVGYRVWKYGTISRWLEAQK